jgi:hypothetical protein
MWTRIKFIINVTLICVTCERMILAWIARGPSRTEGARRIRGL